MMRRLLVAVLLLGSVLTLPSCQLLRGQASHGRVWVFVSNYADDTVSVIDGALDREVKTIPVGKSPQGMALYARGPLLAVANSRGNNITLIDPVKQEALPDTIRVGYFPSDVAINADGKLMAANAYNDNTITVIDLPSRTAIGDPMHFEKKPGRLKFGPDGRLYALLRAPDGALAVIDPATHAVQATIPVGPFPSDLVFTPDGKRLLVGSYDGQTLTVIDTLTQQTKESYRFPTGFGLVIHPIKPLLYSMLSFDDEVLVFDYDARQDVTKLSIGEYPTYSAITPEGRFVYVVNEDSGTVVKLDTETNTPVLKIAVGGQPGAAVVFSE